MPNRADRVIAFIEQAARFCPIGGEELVEETRESKPGTIFSTVMTMKVCPAGHGEIWGEGEYGPDLVFRVNEEVFAEVE